MARVAEGLSKWQQPALPVSFGSSDELHHAAAHVHLQRAKMCLNVFVDMLVIREIPYFIMQGTFPPRSK